MFCPRCGSIMTIDRAKGVLRCPRCGYTVEKGSMVLSKTISHSVKERTVVVDSSRSGVPPGAVLLRGEVRCPKCGHDEVYAWQMQTRAADEPPTTFYRCAKCGHTWREY